MIAYIFIDQFFYLYMYLCLFSGCPIEEVPVWRCALARRRLVGHRQLDTLILNTSLSPSCIILQKKNVMGKVKDLDPDMI
jgi:hypothetical protein